jgi:hypothetical protein
MDLLLTHTGIDLFLRRKKISDLKVNSVHLWDQKRHFRKKRLKIKKKVFCDLILESFPPFKSA